MTEPASLAGAGFIDVHHHFNAPGGRGGQAGWSPGKAVEDMEKAGVSLAIGWPGPVGGSDTEGARHRARFLNDFGADVVRRHPSRFGLFASLPPLHDTEGALAEIDHAFGTLKAEGVGIVTHYGERFLGHADFRPVWEELDRRGALVFVHPMGPGGSCSCGQQGYQSGDMSDAWLEYPFNTARTILSLIATGTRRAYPRIRFIFCHGGGALTPLIGRIEGFTGWFDMGPSTLRAMFPEGLTAEFQQLHFECAQALAPEYMTMLRSLVPDTQILFGTDYDRFPLTHSVERLESLQLPPETRQAIAWGNAQRLLKR